MLVAVSGNLKGQELTVEFEFDPTQHIGRILGEHANRKFAEYASQMARKGLSPDDIVASFPEWYKNRLEGKKAEPRRAKEKLGKVGRLAVEILAASYLKAEGIDPAAATREQERAALTRAKAAKTENPRHWELALAKAQQIYEKIAGAAE